MHILVESLFSCKTMTVPTVSIVQEELSISRNPLDAVSGVTNGQWALMHAQHLCSSHLDNPDHHSCQFQAIQRSPQGGCFQ